MYRPILPVGFFLFELQHEGGVPSVGSRLEQADGSAGELHDLPGERQPDAAALCTGAEEGHEDLPRHIVGDGGAVVDTWMYTCSSAVL